MPAGIDHLARDHLVGQAAALVIDVLQEQIERGDALGQAALDGVPFGAGDDARQEVVRKDPLGALFAAIDGEGDALVEERQVGRLLLAAHFVGRQLHQHIVDKLVVRPHRAGAGEHFVVSVAQVVRLKRIRANGPIRKSGSSHDLTCWLRTWKSNSGYHGRRGEEGTGARARYSKETSARLNHVMAGMVTRLGESRLESLLESAKLLNATLKLEDLLRHLLRTVMGRLLVSRCVIGIEKNRKCASHWRAAARL